MYIRIQVFAHFESVHIYSFVIEYRQNDYNLPIPAQKRNGFSKDVGSRPRKTMMYCIL